MSVCTFKAAMLQIVLLPPPVCWVLCSLSHCCSVVVLLGGHCLLRLFLTSPPFPVVSHPSLLRLSLFTPCFLLSPSISQLSFTPFLLHLCVFSPSPSLKTSLSGSGIDPQAAAPRKWWLHCLSLHPFPTSTHNRKFPCYLSRQLLIYDLLIYASVSQRLTQIPLNRREYSCTITPTTVPN